jgi:hypothetical protein
MGLGRVNIDINNTECFVLTGFCGLIAGFCEDGNEHCDQKTPIIFCPLIKKLI